VRYITLMRPSVGSVRPWYDGGLIRSLLPGDAAEGTGQLLSGLRVTLRRELGWAPSWV